MLTDLFLRLLDSSLAAVPVILAVILARLALKRAPKVLSYALWAVVLVRLLVPFSLPSPVGLLPKPASAAESYSLKEVAVSLPDGVRAAYQATANVLDGRVEPQHIATQQRNAYGHQEYVTANWWEIWVLAGSRLWPMGLAALVLWGAFNYWRLRRCLVGSVRLTGNVWLADYISTPFVLGLIRPRIYLPSDLPEEEQPYILQHERHHIRRMDHVTRLLAYGALCLHWFNPLVWVAFWLAGRDMEMSCDEAVVSQLGGEIRADYAQSLLRLSTGEFVLNPTPLTFGEGGTETRILNLARWRQPAVWAVLLGSCLCILLASGLVTDRPEAPARGVLSHEQVYEVEALLYQAPQYSFSLVAGENTMDYYFSREGMLLQCDKDAGWQTVGQLTDVQLNARNFDLLFLERRLGSTSPAAIRRDNQYAMELVTEEGGLYDLLVQKTGEIYLAQGYAEGDRRTIRWVMALEENREAAPPPATALPGGLNQVGMRLPFGADARSADLTPAAYYGGGYQEGEYTADWLWSYTFLDTIVFEGAEQTAAALLEAGKNPGLGVRMLHGQGITGAGVRVAIIDENEVMTTADIENSLDKVEWIHTGISGQAGPRQGSALAGLLVGDTVGTAPDAVLEYYVAKDIGKEVGLARSEALERILEENETRPPEQRVRVVVSSVAGSPGYGTALRWNELMSQAADKGVLVLDTHNTGYIQAGYYDLNDAENPAACNPGRPGQRNYDGKLYVPAANRTVMEAYLPGEDHWRYDGMGSRDGALAYAAGVAAMGFQMAPHMTAEQCRQLLLQSACVIREGEQTARIIDPAAFIRAVTEQYANE